MKIINYEASYKKNIIDLFNKVRDTQIDEFSLESFDSFVSNQYFDDSLFLLLIDNDNLIGFAHGAVTDKSDKTPGYITFVVVDENHQKQGLGKLLVTELEKRLKTFNKNNIRLYFMNPFKLSWKVKKYHVSHPGMPAILYASDYYHFLLKCGYEIDGDIQEVFYKNIETYEPSNQIKEITIKNKLENLYVDLYKKEFFGFEELFKDLNNPTWLKVVENNLNKNNYPMLVVINNENKILGWTGPLYNEKSGRGYFGGIGVSPFIQGKGLGQMLFSELLNFSKHNGSQFMTLFTGKNNKAKNMYLKFGFEITDQFYILGKKI